MAEGLSLYQVLGCEQGALFAELRACFKRRALSVHPDKGGSKEAFQQVLAAFETLADPVARAGYDRRHAAAVRPATTTKAEQDAEAEGGRGSKRKRRRTGEERQQKSSSSAPGGAPNPREEQRPKQQQQQPQAKKSTSRADQDVEAEGGGGSKRKRRRTGEDEERQQNSSSSAPAGAATPLGEQQPKQQHQHQQQQPKQQHQQQQQAMAKQSTGASTQDRHCQKQDDSAPASQTQELEAKKTPRLAEQAPAEQQQQQTPQQQKSQRAAQVSEESLFEKLRQLLQILPPAFRKDVIGELPQNMRRALELWMLDRRTQATRTDPEVSRKLCQRSGDCSEDTSDDSSHDSSECNEAEADCALALCDTTAACRDASCEEFISTSDDSSDMSEQEPEDTRVVVFSGASVPEETLSIIGQRQQQQQSLEEEFSPEVAAEGSRRSGHGRTGVRGIVNVKDTSYRACQLIGIFGLVSKFTSDLATALDHLAIITVLKQRVQHGILDGDTFEDCMRRALVETGSEVGVEAMKDLGLKFFLTLSKSYWIGCHTKVVTPRIACLETALAYRRQFAELQQALSHRGVVSPGILNRLSMADLEDNWNRFSALYIEACCGLGETANFDASSPKSREAVAKRLAALVEANSATREKQLRAWNCRHMLQEDRLQRQAARAERRTLLRDRRAMSREDRDEARRRKVPSKLVKKMVRRWERLQSQRRRQAAAVLQQELAKQRAATVSNCKELAKQRAAARVELRRCRTEKEERWRWMNRRDLTMADMLGQQAL
ncbi:unnamed protein product [Polarella glacialis]|uniref:J domain-containing protein n=1 Tax=Polarella glacialis TaxID=89957 RepID=A0A813LPJ8_POLGL|nr:unnamed protein product [Polarella glacialis]